MLYNFIRALILSPPFYYLTLKKCNTSDDVWSIHGLWPQFNQTTWPAYCKNVSFNISTLEPLESQLKQRWFSCDGSPESFWEHEWKKHGSCMFVPTNEFTYFNRTLHLFQNVQPHIGVWCTAGLQCMIPFNLHFDPTK